MVRTKWHRLIFMIFLIAFWEGAVQLKFYNPALLPSISLIIESFIKGLISGELSRAIFYSLLVIAKGLSISFVIASALVLLSRAKAWLDDLLTLVMTIAHPLPGIAILPLVILWFGIGEKAILFVVVHSMLWPIVLTLREGVIRLHQQYARIGTAFNLTLKKRIYHLYFMGSMPSLLTGAKMGWSRGWRAFISAEMVFGIVGERSGLGWYLFEQRVYFDAPGLYAGLIAIIMCGVLIEKVLFEKIEKGIGLRWS